MNKITVTHLAYSVNYQTAAYRLHKSLLDAKVNSNMLVGSKSIIDSAKSNKNKNIASPKIVLTITHLIKNILDEGLDVAVFFEII